MKQVNVALPDETRGYLEEIAAKNGRKLSEEVRARLDQSVVDDRFDELTKELGRDLMWNAFLLTEGQKHISPEGTSWRTDVRLFQALKVAVEWWLTDMGRQLDLKSLTDESIDPVTLGKSTAQSYAHLKPMMIKHRPGGDNMEGKR